MKIIFIMNGIGSEKNLPGISGGDIRWIEIAKLWQEMGHEIHVLTPKIGKEFCTKLGLDAKFHVSKVPDKYSIKTYVIRAIKSFFLPNSLHKDYEIVYSTTELWYDVIPALKIKIRCNITKWGAVVHWVAPIKRSGTTFLNSILFYINQRFGLYFIKKYAGVILAVSNSTSQKLNDIGFNKDRIISVPCGVNYNAIRKITQFIDKKEYDAIYMKRFDGTKGVFDIVEIWKEVVKKNNNARLGMIGLGTADVMNKLKKMIENYNLDKNIKIIGPIYDFNQKFSILANSHIFVLPTYEENWAIVIGEAMATGIPVICYDIPEIRPIWKNNIIWIKRGDKKAFAESINKLLNNDLEIKIISNKGLQFIQQYDWRNIAKRELKLILNN